MQADKKPEPATAPGKAPEVAAPTPASPATPAPAAAAGLAPEPDSELGHLRKVLATAKAAQEKYATYTQEQVKQQRGPA